MKIVKGDELMSAVDGIISAKKQAGPYTLDLTVKSIAVIARGGKLDFGGDEHEQALMDALFPIKASPEEEFGWWKLERGTYIVRFNETITQPNVLVVIMPHRRLLAAGASHPSTVVEGLDEEFVLPIDVGVAGISIKENARLARAVLLQPE